MLRAAIVAAALCLAAPAAADMSSDALTHADASRALGYTGRGVTVAVLDTGVDHQNLEVAGAVVAEHCFVAPDGCPDGTAEQDGPGSAQDDEGHGTAIADVIAGKGANGPAGVAPDASLVVVKVADRNGRTTSAQIVAGLNWVRTHHPEAKIVNVSLGSDVMLSGDCTGLSATLSSYATAIDALRAQGATVFASSGNGGSHASMTAPACIHDAVAVGAVYSRAFGSFTAPFVCNDNVTARDEIACFSNSSPELDLLAAGAPVDAARLGSGDTQLAGTSLASAQAAGAAAALLQADPALTPDGLLNLLESTGVPITDPRNGFTRPRIDLAAALGKLLGEAIPLPPAADGATGPAAPIFSKPTVPNADLSIKPISFGVVAVHHSATRRLVIRNAGTGFLNVRAEMTGPPLTASPAKLVIAAATRSTISVVFKPTGRGSYRAALRLRTDDPSAPTIVIMVSGTAG